MINPLISEKLKTHSLIVNSINHNQNLLYSQIQLNTLKDSSYIEHYKTVSERHKQTVEQIDLYKREFNRLINIKYDIKNVDKFECRTKADAIEYIKSDIELNYLNKQIHYKDISILQILKVLREKHSINNFDYKESIKRLNENKPLRGNVRERINAYYGTIKTNTANFTQKKLKQKENNRPFIYSESDGLRYQVILKKTFRLQHTFKHNIDAYGNYFKNAIDSEFKIKLASDNRFKTIYKE